MNKKFIRALCHEPLTHFLILGGLLFVVYMVLQPAVSVTEDSARVYISNQQIKQLNARFAKVRGRPPIGTETEELIENHIKETLYYREALALGLDQDDPVIRNRLRQKFAFLQESLHALTEPTEQQLQQFLAAHSDQYMNRAKVSFEQIYLGEQVLKTPEQIEIILAVLQVGKSVENLGQPTLLPRAMTAASLSKVSATFGEQFAKSLQQQTVGKWAGPIASAFGLHLILMTTHSPSQPADFNQIKNTLHQDYLYNKRKEAEIIQYQNLRKQYQIIIGTPEQEAR